MVLFRATPSDALRADVLQLGTLSTTFQLHAAAFPWKLSFDIKAQHGPGFLFMSEPQLYAANAPFAPAVGSKWASVIGWGRGQDALDFFSESRASEMAISLWNSAQLGLPGDAPIAENLTQIFNAFRSIISRKAFIEKRVHRFIDDHARMLLPPFARKWSEHSFYLNGTERIADIILEREHGMPAWLIELESPAAPVFKKNGDLTYEANHAKGQITEWDQFITLDPARNAAGEFAFLAGPRQRLVVIGRGLQHRDLMLRSRFSDTIIWTYDLLLEQAIERWERELNAQRQLLRLDPVKLFRD